MYFKIYFYTFEDLNPHKNTKINNMINYIKNIYHTILNMNIAEIITKYKLLEEENKKLQDELMTTKEHLNIYTMKNKIYYENNKEEQKQRVKDYKEKTNYSANLPSERKKEYARTAYLNKKEKLKNLEETNEII